MLAIAILFLDIFTWLIIPSNLFSRSMIRLNLFLTGVSKSLLFLAYIAHVIWLSLPIKSNGTYAGDHVSHCTRTLNLNPL